MSEMDDNKTKQFDHMSTEELEQLIRVYAQSTNDADMDVVFSILEVIEKRENLKPSGKYTDVDAAWVSFQANYRPSADDDKPICDDDRDISCMPSKKLRRVQVKRHKLLLRTASILAAVLVILISGTIVASALGYDLLGAVAKWTSETFGFVVEKTEAPSQSNTGTHSATTYKNMGEALSYYGIETALAPKWIPQDFVITDLVVTESPRKVVFVAKYSNKEKNLTIEISKLTDGTNGTYEKDNENTSLYEMSGIAHYIMSNNEQIVAVWKNANFECTIYGNVSENYLKKMIDSIYER